MDINLVSEEEKRLRLAIYTIAVEEFERAREHSIIDNRMLRSQKEASDFFKKDERIIRRWETEGLPFGQPSGSTKFYDKVDCWKWILKQ